MLFVTGVHEEATADDLKEHFSDAGKVINQWMNLDRQTGYVKVCVTCMRLALAPVHAPAWPPRQGTSTILDHLISSLQLQARVCRPQFGNCKPICYSLLVRSQCAPARTHGKHAQQ